MDYDPFEVFSQLDGSSILEHKMAMVLVAITDGPYCDGGFVVADTLERLILGIPRQVRAQLRPI